jgi:hypothetical protein
MFSEKKNYQGNDQKKICNEFGIIVKLEGISSIIDNSDIILKKQYIKTNIMKQIYKYPILKNQILSSLINKFYTKLLNKIFPNVISNIILSYYTYIDSEIYENIVNNLKYNYIEKLNIIKKSQYYDLYNSLDYIDKDWAADTIANCDYIIKKISDHNVL